MDILAFVFGGVRVIFGYAILLFIPGFLVSMVLFPKVSDLRLIERLAYSMVLSIGSVIAYVLFMDVILGIDTTPRNLILTLIGLSLVLTLIWLARHFFIRFSLTEKLSGYVNKRWENCILLIKKFLKNMFDRVKNRKIKFWDQNNRDL